MNEEVDCNISVSVVMNEVSGICLTRICLQLFVSMAFSAFNKLKLVPFSYLFIYELEKLHMLLTFFIWNFPIISLSHFVCKTSCSSPSSYVSCSVLSCFYLIFNVAVILYFLHFCLIFYIKIFANNHNSPPGSNFFGKKPLFFRLITASVANFDRR